MPMWYTKLIYLVLLIIGLFTLLLFKTKKFWVYDAGDSE